MLRQGPPEHSRRAQHERLPLASTALSRIIQKILFNHNYQRHLRSIIKRYLSRINLLE